MQILGPQAQEFCISGSGVGPRNPYSLYRPWGDSGTPRVEALKQ